MEFHSEKLKNPEFFCENRLPAHSDHEAFACLEDLEAGENRLRMSLNGYWKFFYAVNEKQLIPGFEQPEYDCADWADIAAAMVIIPGLLVFLFGPETKDKKF